MSARAPDGAGRTELWVRTFVEVPDRGDAVATLMALADAEVAAAVAPLESEVRLLRQTITGPTPPLHGESGCDFIIRNALAGQEDFVRGWNAAMRSRWPHPPEATPAAPVVGGTGG